MQTASLLLRVNRLSTRHRTVPILASYSYSVHAGVSLGAMHIYFTAPRRALFVDGGILLFSCILLEGFYPAFDILCLRFWSRFCAVFLSLEGSPLLNFGYGGVSVGA